MKQKNSPIHTLLTMDQCMMRKKMAISSNIKFSGDIFLCLYVSAIDFE